MNRVALPSVLIPTLLLVAGFTSCGPAADAPAAPEAPVAFVTLLNQEAVLEVGEPIYLDGSESHLGANTEGLGLELTYHWSISTRPTDSSLLPEDIVALPAEGAEGDETDPSRVELITDVAGIYGISLQVSDGQRNSDVAHVTLEIGGDNGCPTANAGDDLIGFVDIPLSLDGSGSSDPDAASGDDDDSAAGDDLNFIWEFSLVPDGSELTDASIYHQGTDQPIVIPDVEGTYILQLRVDDGACTSLPDYVTLQAYSENQPPVSDAGESIILTPCSPSSVTLDGTGSYDPEGGQIGFEWSFTAVPNGSEVTDAFLSGRFTETPTFNSDVPGIYALQVVVNDGSHYSQPDYVAVQVVPPLPNGGPTADAGDNIVIDLNAACTFNNYGTPIGCNPCPVYSVAVSGSGSSDPDNDDLNFEWVQVSGNTTLLGDNTEEMEITFPETNVSPGGLTSVSAVFGLTVFDCQAADNDTVTVTLNCNG